MPAFDWDADLPDATRDTLIEKIASRVVQLGMAAPAVLVLEMHKPLAFLASQSLLLGSGLLAPIFGPQNVQQYVRLLESRENIERVIQRIEELHAAGLTPAPRPNGQE